MYQDTNRCYRVRSLSFGLRRVYLFTAMVFLFYAFGVFAQEVVPSKITQVTLFSNQALIKKEAKVKVKKGLSELFLEVSAFNVDKDSVSAKVFGQGEIFSVQCKEVYVEEAPQEKIRVLEEKIRELTRARTKLVDEKNLINKKELFLSSVIDFSHRQIPQDIKTQFPKIDDLKMTLAFLDDSYKEINKKKEALDVQTEDITREIDVLESELSSLRRYQQKTKRVIEVLFNSTKDQMIEIETQYVVSGAFWEPLYKVDVPLSLEEVNLVMFSQIRQKTGEDWDDVTLSISNVIPLKGAVLPPLEIWFLDVMRYRADAKAGRLYNKFDYANIGTEAPPEMMVGEEASFVQAQRKELPFSFEYELPQRLTIESKDKETLLPLFSKTLQGEFFYYAVPKVNPLTFLVCRATADKELLSGPLNVSFGGRFIGKTFLPEKKAGEEFELNVGAARDVKVRREKVKDKIKETFFGKIERKTIIREIAYKIMMENLKNETIKLYIVDAIPVSKTDKIELKDVKIEPQPQEENYRDKQGVTRWEVMLAPGEKKEISIEFVVTYPKDLPLSGL